MKRLSLSIVAATALFSSFAALAESASVTQTGAFVSVTGSKSHFDVDRDRYAMFPQTDRESTAFGALVGYRWVVARPFAFGVEAGYMHLGNTTWKALYGGLSIHNNVRQKTKANAFLVGVNGKWDLPYDLTVTARIGVAHIRAKSDLTETITVSNVLTPVPAFTKRSHPSWSGNRVYGGVGVGYDFSENVGLTLSYDRYSFKTNGAYDPDHAAHVGLLGLTAEYRFY